MTKYRDYYRNDKNFNFSNGGPYKQYIGTYSNDGYDWEDEMYDENVDDNNDYFDRKLATKGGQLNHDWDNIQKQKNYNDRWADYELQKDLDDRNRYVNGWPERGLYDAAIHKRAWVKGKNPYKGFNKDAVDYYYRDR
jgi:hypothetical protein